MRSIRSLAALAVLAIAGPLAAANLTIGLGTGRHCRRPALSQPDAEQQTSPAHLRVPGRAQRKVADDPRPRDRVLESPIDPTRWEFKLRKECQVPRRQRVHGGGRRRVDRARAEGGEQARRRSTAYTIADQRRSTVVEPYTILLQDGRKPLSA
jgi:hypothetical protein